MKKKSGNVDIAVFLLGAFIANAISYFISGNLIVSIVSGLIGGILSYYLYSLTSTEKKKSESEIEKEKW